MQGREARDSTTTVIYLISEINKDKRESCLLFTDAEKAFDRADWTFMMQTREEIGLGVQMRNWILSVYSFRRAQIIVNGALLDLFEIRNGTRQGCPLSPLLFIFLLEPFLRAVRRNEDIIGIKVNNEEHKVLAYVDNLLFFVRNPNITVPNLIKEMERYGSLSNFHINWSKSLALNLTMKEETYKKLNSTLLFKWSDSHINYLGIEITKDPKILYIYTHTTSPIVKKH